MVMEHLPSDLKKVIGSARKINFTEEHATILLYNILCAINFIHSTNLMHRDLKPANILVNDQCQVKICDFGFTRPVPFSQLVLP